VLPLRGARTPSAPMPSLGLPNAGSRSATTAAAPEPLVNPYHHR